MTYENLVSTLRGMDYRVSLSCSDFGRMMLNVTYDPDWLDASDSMPVVQIDPRSVGRCCYFDSVPQSVADAVTAFTNTPVADRNLPNIITDL